MAPRRHGRLKKLATRLDELWETCREERDEGTRHRYLLTLGRAYELAFRLSVEYVEDVLPKGTKDTIDAVSREWMMAEIGGDDEDEDAD